MRALAAVALYVGGACAPGQPVSGGDTLLTGDWGGAHIALALHKLGGVVEYDCAHGGISEPFRARNGRIDVAGVHVREHGGPVREGERADSVPARFIGTLHDNALTLRVLVGTDTIGPYELQRGAQPQLFKCL